MARVERHEPGTPAWFDLMTPDLERARGFYGELFGWSFEVGPSETGHYTMCSLNGRNAAGMGQMNEQMPFPPSWNVYLAVADVTAAANQVKKNGGKIVSGPMDVMDQGRLAFCADPTGAHFGMWQSLAHKGAQVVDEPGAMTWSEVYTRDAQRAREFYAKTFGLEARKMEGGMEYWTFHKGSDKAWFGLMQMDERQFPKGVPPYWQAYFAVADTDASVSKVKRLGGKVQAPPFDTPYGRMSVVADPAGAMFAVITLPKS